MTDHLTKEEAEKQAQKKGQTFTRGSIICPIYQDYCTKMCASIVKPWARCINKTNYPTEDYIAKYAVQDWTCDNPLITGVFYVES